MAHQRPDIPPPGADSGRRCDFCHAPIVIGQHYLRIASIFDTAGSELLGLVDLPDSVNWLGVYDFAGCAALALAKAGNEDPLFTDVFNR